MVAIATPILVCKPIGCRGIEGVHHARSSWHFHLANGQELDARPYTEAVPDWHTEGGVGGKEVFEAVREVPHLICRMTAVVTDREVAQTRFCEEPECGF